MKTITVRILRLNKNHPLPYQATPAAVGFDLYATEDTLIKAHGFAAVGTGIAIELPPGVEAQIRPRSGLAFRHGIGILNSPGTIDPDYRGEIKVVLFNVSATNYEVKRGERIAQIVFAETVAAKFEEVDSLSSTQRGEGGFGHTG